MAKRFSPTAVRDWSLSLHRDAVRVLEAITDNDRWTDPDGGTRKHISGPHSPSYNVELVRLKTDVRHAREHAVLLAHTLGVEPGEVPEAQMDKILEFLATRLAEEGEPLGADLLRDEEVRRDVRIEFCGDEPRGAGADPYGRPSPTTNPEFWME